VSEQQPKNTLEGALDLVSKEAMRRLKSDADEIPNHVLFRLFGDLNKVIERRDAESEDEESRPFRLLDEIPVLPKEHARDLIRVEISRLEQERLEYIAALESLDEREEKAA
jgi:hypothetical protein